MNENFQRIIADFFTLLHHHETPEYNKEWLHSLQQEGLDSYAILLVCNRRNQDIFCSLEVIHHLCEKFNTTPLPENIRTLQCCILHILATKPSLKVVEELTKRLISLRECGVLEYDEEQKMRSILHQLRPKPKQIELNTPQKNENLFKENIAKIHQLLLQNTRILETYHSKQKAFDILESLQNQHFSIGVTGVMSSGKSTLLNAILQKEVLGTSVIPETANLTILKYGEQESGKIYFWNKAEWDNIRKSATFNDGIAAFVRESEEKFKDQLMLEITEQGKVMDITIDSLQTYTSAKNPHKYCNLVKSVEIFTPLEFLKNGVELVDTPGLDDPLTQREEITKTYLTRCDVIVHLMNAAQSATQKDIDFIVDALTNKNVSRFLVVLTHVDTISHSDLQAVLEYTQTSIQNRLLEFRSTEGFDQIIERIEFIPTAAYMALLHRTNRAQEALEKGYTLEDSGILKLESILRELLFGSESEKSRTLLYGSCRKMIDLFSLIQSEIELKKSLIQEGAESLQKRLKAHHEHEQNAQSLEKKVKQSISESTTTFMQQFEQLGKAAIFKLKEYEQLLKNRLIDEVNYANAQNHSLQANHIEKNLIIGIQDGVTEARRDFCYKLERSLHFFFQEIRELFYAFEELDNRFIDEKMADTQILLLKKFKERPFIDQTSIIPHSAAQLALKKQGSELKKELDQLFILGFDALSERTETWIKILNDEILEECTQTFGNLYSFVHEKIRNEKEILENALEQRTNTETQDKEKDLLLEEEALFDILNTFESILKEVS
ncbi:hypothetical protein CCZ01_01245 [Helicobacter monodelphidis]|uniref:dynamin family protein n=1 Tax=Helicobacter sp. 15-1451 TaxID=2004995 RepID=UPI000DCDEF2F|nr:dynamin family protein [Helicobacter sp. 15-1451]RAX58849.1 hypothetical protein CCZ01_01245 [Helicobacter sp. 15-1451]